MRVCVGLCYRVLTVDRVVLCPAPTVSTNYLKPYFSSVLDQQGKVKVGAPKVCACVRGSVPCPTSLGCACICGAPLRPCLAKVHVVRAACVGAPFILCLFLYLSLSPLPAQVVRTMQVVGFPHVFAGGDVCMRTPHERKSYRTALTHSVRCGSRLFRSLHGFMNTSASVWMDVPCCALRGSPSLLAERIHCAWVGCQCASLSGLSFRSWPLPGTS